MGLEYIGVTNVTSNGQRCLNWAEEFKRHGDFGVVFSPYSTEESENYCRNPGYPLAGPFCMINDDAGNITYGECGIPFCGE